MEASSNSEGGAGRRNLRGTSDRNVQFSNVIVYSFAREQGFCVIPDTGWCSLGMARRHFSVSRYDVNHHQLMVRLRRRRRRWLSRQSRFLSLKRSHLSGHSLARRSCVRGAFANLGSARSENRINCRDSSHAPVFSSPPPLSPQALNDSSVFCDLPASLLDSAIFSATVATPPPPCLSPPSPRRVLARLDESLGHSSLGPLPEILDTDSEASLDQLPAVNSSKSVHARYQKLVPIHASARIRLLKESGVAHLDESEREKCSQVRAARSRVGCGCGPRYPCVVGRCCCALDGVQCHVDRTSFPCSCIAENCHNPHGRTEFSHEKVRAHIFDVLHRLNNRPSSTSTDSDIVVKPCGDAPTHSVQPKTDVHASEVEKSSESVLFFKGHELDSHACSRHVMRCPFQRNDVISDDAVNQTPPSASNACNQTPSNHDTECKGAWISSTPAYMESDVRRVLFKDMTHREPAASDVPVLHHTPPVPPSGQLPGMDTYECEKPVHSVELAPLHSNIVTVSEFPIESPHSTLNLPVSSVEQFDSCTHTASPHLGSSHSPCYYGSRFPTEFTSNPQESDLLERPPCDSTSERHVEMASCDQTLGTHALNTVEKPITPLTATSCRHRENVTFILNDERYSPLEQCDNSNKSLLTCSTGCQLTGRFVSKSAPNSPCPSNAAQLSRLSLRRRAILRLPVTPIRRAPRPPRTPNKTLVNSGSHSSSTVTDGPFVRTDPSCTSGLDSPPVRVVDSKIPRLRMRTPLKPPDSTCYPLGVNDSLPMDT